MADVKWIKITTDIFNDEKIRLIEQLPECDAIIVIWFKILALAGKSNNDGFLMLNDKIAYTEDMLVALFNRPKLTVKLALETFENFGMIEITNNGLYISNWEKHQNIEGLDKIREQNRIRQQKHREKQKILPCNVTSNVTITESNATEEEIEKEKEYNNNVQVFFEQAWKKYPNKVGKGKISLTKKKEVCKFGDEFLRCIDRYVKYVNSVDWLKMQNGSTFFNSGYVDYLDENYIEKEKQKVIDTIERLDEFD